MKYKNKLFLTFNLIVFISVAIGLAIVYTNTYRLVFNQIRSELLSTALIAATAVNGDLIKTLTTTSVDSPQWEEVVDHLRWIRNANRRKDFFVKYLYLVSPEKQGKVVYLLDTEEDPNVKSYFGELLVPPVPALKGLKEPTLVIKAPGFAEWGTWLTAFIPIYDSEHKVTAILGMDAGAEHTQRELINLLFYGVISLAGALAASTLIAYFLSKLATQSLNAICDCVKRIGSGDFTMHVHLTTRDEFNDLALTVNEMADGLAQKERLTLGFSRYVSHHVLEAILKSNTSAKLEGEKRKVTVMFSDIRQFTKMSEHLPPENVVSFLNEYFEKMISIIFSFHGTLDKFIGDGIMAEFGMPLEDPQQELNAIRTAIEMQRMVKRLSREWSHQGLPPIRIGIGIHTGEAIVGNIGSDIRMEYTAVGDTVYVASGLEGKTKHLQVDIIISEEVYRKVKETDEFAFQDLGLLQLPDRTHPVRAYSVIDTILNP